MEWQPFFVDLPYRDSLEHLASSGRDSRRVDASVQAFPQIPPPGTGMAHRRIPELQNGIISLNTINHPSFLLSHSFLPPWIAGNPSSSWSQLGQSPAAQSQLHLPTAAVVRIFRSQGGLGFPNTRHQYHDTALRLPLQCKHTVLCAINAREPESDLSEPTGNLLVLFLVDVAGEATVEPQQLCSCSQPNHLLSVACRANFQNDRLVQLVQRQG